MVPGAKVEVKVGGVLRASGVAHDGSVRLGLSTATGPGDVLDAQQIPCGIPGPITPLPAPEQVPMVQDRRVLLAPSVEAPLKACQRAVTVSNVEDGAKVTLNRTSSPPESACFDLSSLWFPVPPLVMGETVTAVQEFPACKLKSPSSNAVVVGPTQPVPAPTVIKPLCAGGNVVRLTDLLPGSKVHIYQNNVDLGEGEASESTEDFAVPPLAANSKITAKQELCNHWSHNSNAVKVDPLAGGLPTPVVPGPLFACGAVVRVTNLRPGTTVDVYSTFLGAPIGSQQVYATQADIPVAPQLIAGDHIYAMIVGCGKKSAKSTSVPVKPVPKPGLPNVQHPVDDCMRSVKVTNVISGACVDVYVNNVWRGTGIAGGTSIEVPIQSGSLHVGDHVRARQRICQFITGFGEPAIVVSSVQFNYLTQHFDNARTGWRPYETILNVVNVPHLKHLFTQKVDGTVYAQPLYMHHVLMPGPSAHNVVYVATENDTVYAFDADAKQLPLWKRSLVPPGENVVSVNDIEGCNNIAPVIGITSTPVIDCRSYTMYVVAKTKRVQGSQTTFHYRLHAIDITTGFDRPGSPVEIQAAFPGTAPQNDGHGNVLFTTQWQLNRPALLLLNGFIYIAFGAHCDFHQGTYHGWVVAYNATTLKELAVFNASPNDPGETSGAQGSTGIWQGGMGLAADSGSFIYFTTGNGLFDANVGGADYGDSVLKLSTKLKVSSYFTPADQATLLRPADIDLGSGGVLVLPDQPATASFPYLLVTCGKDGDILLLNRQNLGGYTGPGGNNPQAVQTLPLQPGRPKDSQPGVWGGPAYYHGPNGQFVYYCGSGGHLKAFLFQNGLLLPATLGGGQPNQSLDAFPSEGGTTPNVSSNQQVSGAGVVWAIARQNPIRLQAFDATNLTMKLFDAAAGPWNNPNGGAFIEPTAVNGKVYVGSDGELNIFGL
ncbi:MAG: hypothetical protein OIN85_10055 [Candidatus Methanoperedens sp.]|nr:hypothetical protein [Candidatus Methanoperedens sp.]